LGRPLGLTTLPPTPALSLCSLLLTGSSSAAATSFARRLRLTGVLLSTASLLLPSLLVVWLPPSISPRLVAAEAPFFLEALLRGALSPDDAFLLRPPPPTCCSRSAAAARLLTGASTWPEASHRRWTRQGPAVKLLLLLLVVLLLLVRWPLGLVPAVRPPPQAANSSASARPWSFLCLGKGGGCHQG
jgi:hypothetical protein